MIWTPEALLRADDDERHVVVLRGAGGEGIDAIEDAGDHVGGGAGAGGENRVEETLFVELLFGAVHRFTDAVSISNHQIAGLEIEAGFVELEIREQAEDQTAFFQPNDLPGRAVAAQDGRVVAGVDVTQGTSAGIILRVKTSRVR